MTVHKPSALCQDSRMQGHENKDFITLGAGQRAALGLQEGQQIVGDTPILEAQLLDAREQVESIEPAKYAEESEQLAADMRLWKELMRLALNDIELEVGVHSSFVAAGAKAFLDTCELRVE
jgi:hypothetical protein